MDVLVDRADQVPGELRDQLEAIVARAATVDGIRPLNDLGVQQVQGLRPAQFWGIGEPDLAGFALLDEADDSVQLVVDPDHRRRGLGRALAEATHSAEARSWWSFGTLPAAVALGERLGLEPARTLLKMSRDLSLHRPDPVDDRDDVRIDRFSADDLDDLVRVNAAAFVDHPEQGAVTADDLTATMAQDWFRADDLLLARSTETGELLGFHWTKVEPGDGTAQRGEVYVIGVDPAHEGRGLGRWLLNAGLAHLVARGAEHVDLFVEAVNERVVRMYQSASFGIALRDTSWARPPETTTPAEPMTPGQPLTPEHPTTPVATPKDAR